MWHSSACRGGITVPRQGKVAPVFVAFISSQWRPALDPPHTSGSFEEEREAVLGHLSSPDSPLWHGPEPLELLTAHHCWCINFSANSHFPVSLLHQASALWLIIPAPQTLGPAANGEDSELFVQWHGEKGRSGGLAVILDIWKTAFLFDLRYSCSCSSSTLSCWDLQHAEVIAVSVVNTQPMVLHTFKLKAKILDSCCRKASQWKLSGQM